MKQLLIICAILTASLSYSQGTFPISLEQAKQAIKTAQRGRVLESKLQTQGLIISEYGKLVKDQEEKIAAQSAQLALWKKNYNLQKTRLESEKAKETDLNILEKILYGVGIFATGYLIGNM